jgi:hypothetical protein
VPVEEEIKRRKWRRLGHTLRKHHADVNRTALERNPHKVQDEGDNRIVPGEDQFHTEAKAVGLNWNGVKVAANNVVR